MVIVRTLNAFLLRDWRTARSYRLAWALEVWGSIFQLAIFYFISRIVDTPALATAEGAPIDYFAFVVIGLALYNLLSTGIYVFSSSLRTEQTSGTLEVLLSMPTSPSLTILGTGTYGFAWSLVSSMIMITVAIGAFGLRLVLEPVALLAAFITLVASVALFASLGIVVGAFTLVFKRASGFIGLITQGLGLLSGVYFPTELLPRPLYLLGEAIPFTWALDLLRSALLTGDVDSSRIAILVGASVAGYPLALWIFRRAIQYARKAGSLGQY